MKAYKNFVIDNKVVAEMLNHPTFTNKGHNFSVILYKYATKEIVDEETEEITKETVLEITTENDFEYYLDENRLTNESSFICNIASSDGVIILNIELNNDNFEVELSVNGEVVMDDEVTQKSVEIFEIYYNKVKLAKEQEDDDLMGILESYI